MKKEINKFWRSFSLLHKKLIYAHAIDDKKEQDNICNVFNKIINEIHPKFSVLIILTDNNVDPAKLIFITKGKAELKSIAEQLLAVAPCFSEWQFQIGIKPYKHSVISLCAYSRFLGSENNIYQIYFAVQKIYKTTNKLHIILYLEMDKQLSKSELHDLMHIILMCFLGDVYYHRHISRYRIVRRKYSRIQFIPLDELRHLIQYKTIN